MSPLFCCSCFAISSGMAAGGLVASIQRGGRVDPLLAGVLATLTFLSLASLEFVSDGKTQY